MSIVMGSPLYRLVPVRCSKRALFVALLMLTSIGCGSGSDRSAATTSVTPQPSQPATPAVPPGWVNLNGKYFSFSYPSSWQLSESASATKFLDVAAESGLQHQVAVQFESGFVNQATFSRQCAGVDQYLIDFYTANFASFATSTAQYPYTTTTYDGPQDGPQGRVIRVSITTVSKSASPSTTEYWLEAVQRVEGIYLVMYRDPSDPYSTWLSFRDTFIGTITFKATPLASTAYCNYWPY